MRKPQQKKILEAGFRKATGEEDVTMTFVENVLTINARMLSDPPIREALEAADDQLPHDQNPFAKVNILHLICTKAGSSDRPHITGNCPDDEAGRE